jgi:hypothetical protein
MFLQNVSKLLPTTRRHTLLCLSCNRLSDLYTSYVHNTFWSNELFAHFIGFLEMELVHRSILVYTEQHKAVTSTKNHMP